MNDTEWEVVRELSHISAYELVEMIDKFPAIKISWENFLVNYKLCKQEIQIG